MVRSKLQLSPATRAALLITTALALSGCSLLSKKEEEPADPAAAAATGKPAFTLDVEAPKEIRELLE